MRSQGDPGETATELYLTILSRFPTAEELKAAAAYGRSSKAKWRDVVVDLAWALINSEEFLHRH